MAHWIRDCRRLLQAFWLTTQRRSAGHSRCSLQTFSDLDLQKLHTAAGLSCAAVQGASSISWTKLENCRSLDPGKTFVFCLQMSYDEFWEMPFDHCVRHPDGSCRIRFVPSWMQNEQDFRVPHRVPENGCRVRTEVSTFA